MKPLKVWKTVVMEVDGVKVQLFHIGVLSRIVGRSTKTLKTWELRGHLPETPYRSKTGHRLYTLEMVEAIMEALREAGELGKVSVKPRQRGRYLVRGLVFKGALEPVYMRLYTVGALAQSIKKTPMMVNHLMKRGAIPETPFRSSDSKRGYKLYTSDMISIVNIAVRKRLIGRNALKTSPYESADIYNEIEQCWKDLGVYDVVAVVKPPPLSGIKSRRRWIEVHGL